MKPPTYVSAANPEFLGEGLDNNRLSKALKPVEDQFQSNVKAGRYHS
jgi:hypothetical protein